MVSVILPVYNGAAFLKNTLEQVLNQKYTDFELIIIDDGSTDNSVEICKTYSLLDKRVRFLVQDNKGISATRNKAIEMAKGEYISFVDQDDEIDSSLLLLLVGLIESSGADISKVGYKILDIDEYGRLSKEKRAKSVNGSFEKRDFQSDISFVRDQMQSVWNCLYRKKILDSSGVRFDERMKYGGEDIAFNLSLLPYVSKIESSDVVGYYHYKRVKTSASAKLNQNRIDSIIMIDELEKKIIPCVVDGKSIEYCINSESLANLCLAVSVICQNKRVSFSEKERYLKKIRENSTFDFSIRDFSFVYSMLKKYKFRMLAGMLYKCKLCGILVCMANIRMEKMI